MTRRNDLWWCFANIFRKLFMISVLLQCSLGFNIIEEEYPADSPAFYQFLEAWNIPQKVPRGYMFPTPRVGRRHIHEEKRQNMIPQPRIGRELETDLFYAEILNDMRNIFNLHPPQEFTNINPGYRNLALMAKYQKYLPEQTLIVSTNKGPLSSRETRDVPQLNEDSINTDHKTGISLIPKEERILSKETTPGFAVFDDDRHEGFVPGRRLDRAAVLTALDDKSHIGGLLAYPRLGRHILDIYPALLEHLQNRKVGADPESIDYDILMNIDLDDVINDAFLSKESVVKRNRPLKLIPRIGRKKRSVTDEHSENEKSASESEQNMPNSGNRKSIWDTLQELDDDYYYTLNKKSYRSKNAFIPRIGKKRSDDSEDANNKRAVAFTPRIGRASLIPRIGRNDPKFRLRSRGAFVPRIGRRAALIPRIGRSLNHNEENE